jgi:hypothetical protein
MPQLLPDQTSGASADLARRPPEHFSGFAVEQIEMVRPR